MIYTCNTRAQNKNNKKSRNYITSDQQAADLLWNTLLAFPSEVESIVPYFCSGCKSISRHYCYEHALNENKLHTKEPIISQEYQPQELPPMHKVDPILMIPNYTT